MATWTFFTAHTQLNIIDTFIAQTGLILVLISVEKGGGGGGGGDPAIAVAVALAVEEETDVPRRKRAKCSEKLKKIFWPQTVSSICINIIDCTTGARSTNYVQLAIQTALPVRVVLIKLIVVTL